MINTALLATSSSTTDQKTLRRKLRHKRSQLTPQQRRLAANRALQRLRPITSRLVGRLSSRPIKVGIYLDAFGELPTQPLVNWAYRYGFEVYLPVVKKLNAPLVFIKINHHNLQQLRLVRHRLGMRQPATGRAMQASELDVLFMPLVAFDKRGYRMGMGGGFYDRTLGKTKTKPLKIGYAYDFQQVERLAVNPWDVRLDMAVTPSKLHRFSRYLLPKSMFNQSAKEQESSEKNDTDELSEQLINQVMSITRLEQLLAQADAFGFVNSEKLDEF